MKNFFAVFAVSFVDGEICATTRPDGTVGLPGGKVDPGETPVDALSREAREEGWEISQICDFPLHVDYVDGRPVAWHTCQVVRSLTDYKEKSRGIAPVLCKLNDLSKGLGNEFLKELFDLP